MRMNESRRLQVMSWWKARVLPLEWPVNDAAIAGKRFTSFISLVVLLEKIGNRELTTFELEDAFNVFKVTQ